MWLSLTTLTGTKMFTNINRIGAIWETKQGATLLIDGEEFHVRDPYANIIGTIQTAQPTLG